MQFSIHGFTRTTRVVGTADPTEIVVYRNRDLGIEVIESHGVVGVEVCGHPRAVEELATAFHLAAERLFAAEEVRREIAREDNDDPFQCAHCDRGFDAGTSPARRFMTFCSMDCENACRQGRVDASAQA